MRPVKDWAQATPGGSVKHCRVAFDTEFWEQDSRLILISIAMVREDGAELYLENAGFDWEPCESLARLDVGPNHRAKKVPRESAEWLLQHVRPRLQGGDAAQGLPRIADAIADFLEGLQPEFWTYYGARDWVLLGQIFGGMRATSERFPHWPWYASDLKQVLVERGLPDLPLPEGQHHALVDARFTLNAVRNLVPEPQPHPQPKPPAGLPEDPP